MDTGFSLPPPPDPRAEVRRRIAAGACARPGCLRGHAPRALLCAACRADGWAYCPRCERVDQGPHRHGYCRACNLAISRARRGTADLDEAARRLTEARRRGGAVLAAKHAITGLEILSLYQERGWRVEEIARRYGVGVSAIRKRLRYYRSKQQ